jgi:hypothetical protein
MVAGLTPPFRSQKGLLEECSRSWTNAGDRNVPFYLSRKESPQFARIYFRLFGAAEGVRVGHCCKLHCKLHCKMQIHRF